jgi:hypothetical protein
MALIWNKNSARQYSSPLAVVTMALGIAFLIATLCALPLVADASQWLGPSFDLSLLKGIDTIIVQRTGPATGYPPVRNPPVTSDPVVQAVKDIFSSQPWISIQDGTANEQVNKNKTVFLMYNVSERSEVLSGKPIVVAGVTVQLVRLAQEHSFLRPYTPFAYLPPSSYVFIVPDTTEALDQKVAEGLHYLISNLPSYFACGNKVGNEPCATLVRPYEQEDRPSAFVPGKGEKR